MNGMRRTRLVIVGILFITLYFIMSARLLWIQMVNAPFLHILLNHQRYISLDIIPPRAPIFDRTGQALTFNRQTPSLFVEPQLLSENTQNFIAHHFPNQSQTLKQHANRKFLWIERSLSNDQYEHVAQISADGMHVIHEPQRSYPFVECAQLLGFTDCDNKGIAGLEQYYADVLTGSSTSCMLERDARKTRETITHSILTDGQRGTPLYTTLDSRLQWQAYQFLSESVEKLQAKLGSVIVMDPASGEIIVMATYPGFDPHKRTLDQTNCMKNVPVTESYELGSVMKIFTALAALEEGMVTYDEVINCEGKRYIFDRFPVENWKWMGTMPFYDVMRHSSNVGLAKIAQRLGSKLYDHFYRLGFGRKTSLDFPGQRTGTLHHPHHWSKSTPLVMSFGYELGATLIQLAQATSIVANGGFTVSPHLVQNGYQQHVPLRLYQTSAIQQTKDILALIGQQYPIFGYRVMGKTGTARILKDDGYSTENHNFTFAGIIEQGSFQRVIITFIHDPAVKGLLAAEVAAPLFHKVGTAVAVHHRYHGIGPC